MLSKAWDEVDKSLQGERRLVRRGVETCRARNGETIGNPQVIGKHAQSLNNQLFHRDLER